MDENQTESTQKMPKEQPSANAGNGGSECDLDFILQKPDPDFSWSGAGSSVSDPFGGGYDLGGTGFLSGISYFLRLRLQPIQLRFYEERMRRNPSELEID